MAAQGGEGAVDLLDRKSTRLNSSHLVISYAVFCLKNITDGLGTRHDAAAANTDSDRPRPRLPSTNLSRSGRGDGVVLEPGWQMQANPFFFLKIPAPPSPTLSPSAALSG